ncbi:restriction endonuclease subunit S [Frateuria sp. GZRe14]|uniref:restriction endonuclease subunit S n=1 Tax=Frateuria sp. GZRe14 TaxID=3351534 RepID=UPI003EDC6507
MNWRTATLEDICVFIRNGKSIQQSKEVDGLPITRIETIANESIDEHRVGYAGVTEDEAGDHLLQTGDILFSHINSLDHLGKTAIYEGRPRQLVHGMNLLNLRPDQAAVLPSYLLHVLRAPMSRAKFQRIANKSVNQASISAGNLKKVVVPLPPLAEQRRIAAILDKADALRAKRREAIAKLGKLLQSVFLDMFGDPVTNPKGWPRASIGSFASFITSGSRGWAKYYADSGAKFIRIQNLVNGELDMEECAFVRAPESAEARRTLVQEGDVLVSITADLGRTAVVPEGLGAAHINQHIAILRLSGIDPSYVSHFLAGPGGQIQFEKLNRSAVKAGLNFDDLRSLQIFVPPVDVQGQYLQRIESIKNLRRSNDLDFLGLDKLFFGLQQRAFAGTL